MTPEEQERINQDHAIRMAHHERIMMQYQQMAYPPQTNTPFITYQSAPQPGNWAEEARRQREFFNKRMEDRRKKIDRYSMVVNINACMFGGWVFCGIDYRIAHSMWWLYAGALIIPSLIMSIIMLCKIR